MILILDTETTGLTREDRIVSICWAIYTTSAAKMAVKHHIIYPQGFEIPYRVAQIHGITTEMARSRGIPLEKALKELSSDIDEYKPVLYVGHNVTFDRPMVLNEYGRIHIQENLSRLPTFCTMRSTTEICRLPRYGGRGYKWPKLNELHHHLFGFPHKSAHDAAGDVEATAKCYFELLRRRHGAAREIPTQRTGQQVAPAPIAQSLNQQRPPKPTAYLDEKKRSLLKIEVTQSKDTWPRSVLRKWFDSFLYGEKGRPK